MLRILYTKNKLDDAPRDIQIVSRDTHKIDQAINSNRHHWLMDITLKSL